MRKQPNIDHFLLKKTCFPRPKAGNPIPGFELKAFGSTTDTRTASFWQLTDMFRQARNLPPSPQREISANFRQSRQWRVMQQQTFIDREWISIFREIEADRAQQGLNFCRFQTTQPWLQKFSKFRHLHDDGDADMKVFISDENLIKVSETPVWQ